MPGHLAALHATWLRTDPPTPTPTPLLPLQVPPLRARPADIKPLARHYLALYAARTGAVALQLDDRAMRHLVSYSFPVNLEELKTIVERVAIQARAAQQTEGAVPRAAPAAAVVPAAACACSGAAGACKGGAEGDATCGIGHACGCKPAWEEEEAAPAEVLALRQEDFWFATQASRCCR